MNKTMKKILIVLSLFMMIIVLRSTVSFGYIANQEEAFKAFKDLPDREISLYLGGKIQVIEDYLIILQLKPTISIGDSTIIEIENEWQLKAKKVGTTNVEVKATYGEETIVKKMKIKVVQTKENTKLESKTNDVVSISGSLDTKNQILLANGELWNAKDKTYKLAKKKAGNVSKYVYSEVYEDRNNTSSSVAVRAEATLKKDGNLTIRYPKVKVEENKYENNGKTYTQYIYTATKKIKTKKVSKIKDMCNYGYLNQKGEFYFYDLNKNGLQITKKITAVKKILSDYVVTKKGKTYAISGKKICDFEAVQVDKMSQCINGLILDKKGNLYSYEYDEGYGYNPTTNKYEKIRDAKYIVKKVDKDVKTIIGYGTYETKKGKIKQYGTYFYENNEENILERLYIKYNDVTLKRNKKLYLNNVSILNNVDDIYTTSDTKKDSVIIVRKDGSIWRLDLSTDNSKLTKVRSGKDKYKVISKPTNLKASKSGKNNVKVKWSKVEGASKYTIYRATSKNGKYKKIGNSKTNSYSDKKLTKGKKYYYKVVANCSNSKYNSEKSSSIKIKL